jgi:diphosphomevalonate decarboxylase
LNIPAAGSIPLTVDKLTTKTTVNFNAQLKTDAVWLNEKQLDNPQLSRLICFLDLIREVAGESRRAKVISSNNFSTAAGIASSPSGFAALSLAASSLLGLKLAPDEQSAIARRGSGSAARSIDGGFVELVAGD